MMKCNTMNMDLSLSQLRTHYLLGKVPTKELHEFVMKSDPHQVYQLHELTLGQHKYLPPVQFRRKWATFILKQLESSSANSPETTETEANVSLEEAVDVWYETLKQLSTMSTQIEPFYRFYGINEDSDFVKIYENEDAFVCNGTTGLVTWEASRKLANYIASNVKVFESVKWIIELGSGCGYLAIATCKLENLKLQKYLATEGSSEALAQCHKNVTANFEKDLTNCPLIVMPLDWTKSEDVQKFATCVKGATVQYGPGCLIGADIIFDPELIPSLVELFNTFLTIQSSNSCHGGKIILSCEMRNERTTELLMSQLRSHGCKLDQTETWTNGRIYTII